MQQPEGHSDVGKQGMPSQGPVKGKPQKKGPDGVSSCQSEGQKASDASDAALGVVGAVVKGRRRRSRGGR